MDTPIAKKPKLMATPEAETNNQEVSSEVVSAITLSTIDMLPPEMIDRIIQFVIAQKSLSSILNTRMNQLRWRDLVDYQLEKAYSRSFTSLKLEKLLYPERQNQWINSPKLHMSSKTIRVVWCPKFILESQGSAYNFEIPTASLIIDSSNVPSGKELDFTMIPVVTFMSRFASNLAYLTITNVTYHTNDLVKILRKTPKLKGLTMTNVCRDFPDPNLKPLMMVPHPSLTFLKLTDHFTKDEWITHLIVLGREIIEALVGQLTHLTVSGQDSLQLKYLKGEKRYLKLKELVLSDVDTCFFRDNLPLFAPLERLVINNLSLEFFDDKVKGFERVWKFIEQFAPTLLHLHLDIATAMMEYKMETGSLQFGIPFPKVHTLAIPFSIAENYLSLLREYILPLFPAVQKLQLLDNWDTLDDVDVEEKMELTAEEITDEAYWNICKKMKELEVYSITTGFATIAVPQ